MAFATSFAQQTLNTLQVGALRMPMLFASLNGALLVGEGALRVTTSVLKLFFSGDSDAAKWISKRIPTTAVNVMRPHKELSNQALAISALACCTIGILGTQLMAWGFGPAPSIYNDVLTFLGPIRIDDTLHPLLAWARSQFNV